MDYFQGINFAGWGEAPRYNCILERNFESFYGIQYNHSGPFLVKRGDEPARIVSGPHLFISYPGVKFQYGNPPGQRPRHHMYVCFHGVRVASYIEGGLLSVGKDWSLVAVEQSSAFYRNMRTLLDGLHFGHIDASSVHRLEGLLLQIQQQARFCHQPNRYADDLARLGHDIKAEPLLEWDFRKEASGMNISYQHFRRLFQQHFQCPPARFILESRLAYAAEKLCHTDLSVATIAQETGFSDVYHFSRQFKQHLKLTPSRYRYEFIG